LTPVAGGATLERGHDLRASRRIARIVVCGLIRRPPTTSRRAAPVNLPSHAQSHAERQRRAAIRELPVPPC
jgi:hypothetical protein